AVDRAAAAFPGLYWCANWRGGVSVSDCVKNGHAMAGTVHAFAAPAARAPGRRRRHTPATSRSYSRGRS
nr:hypothetical protein [Acidobacteriota bacterium]